MTTAMYGRVMRAILARPLLLWGLSLFHLVLCVLAWCLFGVIPGAALGIVLLLNAAMSMVYLNGYLGKKVETKQLFAACRDTAAVKRVLCGMAWRALWIFLWSLIPVAGIVYALIRTYEYRLTPYILMTEPEISPTEAIRESARRTQGWKGRMFLADFLIAFFVFAIALVLFLLCLVPDVGIVFVVLLVLFLLVCEAVLPLFFGVLHGAFYEEIKHPTIPQYPVYNPYGSFHQPTNQQNAASGTFCTHCGSMLPAGSSFCTQCGNSVKP